MKHILILSLLLMGTFLYAQNRFDVSSASEFSLAQEQAVSGDSIVWVSGTYTHTRMDIDKDGLTITAEPYGTVLFTGVSRAVINADSITFSGFQYIGGFIGNLDVIRVFGSDVLITHVNIQNYTSHKYLVVDELSRRTTISYCNFENRLNLDDKNILSILVDDEPGFHKIQYCSFKNFEGIGKDEGIEPIRIGVSTQGHLDSRTLVEYCYFTQCNGDGEIISHKSRQNVYRYNTFEDNPVAELVLRHGDEGVIYGNFFLNNMGGIRVREGSDHFIYNNYFEGVHRRSIYLQNDPSDPLSDIHIYHNTIVNSEEFILGGFGNHPPSNVTIANNVFANPIDDLFTEDTGNETWINNIVMGELGIDSPVTGLSDTDPLLGENVEGFLQPELNSPLIGSAVEGYPPVPLYPGMDYDYNILLDVMGASRPTMVSNRAIGASEYSDVITVQPHATEMNTGPSYLFDNLVDYVAANASQLYIGKEGESRAIRISSNVDWVITDTLDWISANVMMGAGDAELVITIEANPDNSSRAGTFTIVGASESVTIQVFQDAGDPVGTSNVLYRDVRLFPNPTDGMIKLHNLPSELLTAQVEVIHLDGKSILSVEERIINNELILDFHSLDTGAYILHTQFFNHEGDFQTEMSIRFVRN